MVERGQTPTKISLPNYIWNTILRPALGDLVSFRYGSGRQTLFGLNLTVVDDPPNGERYWRIFLEDDTGFRHIIPLHTGSLDSLRGIRFDRDMYEEMTRRMMNNTRAENFQRDLDRATTLADTWRGIASRVNPPVFVASTPNGETFGRSAVYDQAVDRNPSRESDCPASRIGVECRQWTDEQLQSVRTILIQEGKRRKHGES